MESSLSNTLQSDNKSKEYKQNKYSTENLFISIQSLKSLFDLFRLYQELARFLWLIQFFINIPKVLNNNGMAI
jgi:hypothetical protein